MNKDWKKTPKTAVDNFIVHYLNLDKRLELYIYDLGHEWSERYQVNVADIFAPTQDNNYILEFKEKKDAIAYVRKLTE